MVCVKWTKKVGDEESPDSSPGPRSGHTAVALGLPNDERVLFYGGIRDKKFLGDLKVLTTNDWKWSAIQAQAGPGERAFHCAVMMGSDMYVLCGRTHSRQKCNDVWKLDTLCWRWEQVRAAGAEAVVPRDFASAAPIPGNRILLYGGHSGSKWLSSLHVLDVATSTWSALEVSPGPAPPPRSAHTAVLQANRLLLFGGQGPQGHILGDLWILNGLEGSEPVTWSRQPLTSNSPSPRAGCSAVVAGAGVVYFGGHSNYSSWLARPQELYLNDAALLCTEAIGWERCQADCPPAVRAYHSLTLLASGSMLLYGGFNGKTTFADAWHLHVPPAAPEKGQASEPIGCLDAGADERAAGADSWPNEVSASSVRASSTAQSAARSAAQSAAQSDARVVGPVTHPDVARERTKTVGLVSGGVATVASHVGSGVGSVFRALGSLGSNVGSISSTTLAVLGRTVPKTQAQAPSVSPHLKCLLEDTQRLRTKLGLGGQASSGHSLSDVHLCRSSHDTLWKIKLSRELWLANEDLQELRTNLSKCHADTIRISDLPALLLDYRRLVVSSTVVSTTSKGGMVVQHDDDNNWGRFRFFHLDVEALRLKDVPELLEVYHSMLIAYRRRSSMN